MIVFSELVATVATVETTASWPWKASIRASGDVKSTLLTVILVVNVAVDSRLMMAVTSKPDSRRAAMTGTPRFPEA